eukprot:3018664-Alexandrium_andersonii.AAC.1
MLTLDCTLAQTGSQVASWNWLTDRVGQQTRPPFVVFEPRRGEGAPQVRSGRHDCFFAEEATCPGGTPLAGTGSGNDSSLDSAIAL